MQKLPPSSRAFSLVELLAVICIALVMAGLAAPAFGVSKSGQLNTASRQASNLLTVARTEAITKGMPTRFVVATKWPGEQDGGYRRMSIWKLNAAGSWEQLTRWEATPNGVVFDADAPQNVGDSTSSIFKGQTGNVFPTTVNGASVETIYAEFSPTGAATIGGGPGTDVWLSLASGRVSDSGATIRAEAGDNPANWSKISISTLTGRLKTTRPQ